MSASRTEKLPVANTTCGICYGSPSRLMQEPYKRDTNYCLHLDPLLRQSPLGACPAAPVNSFSCTLSSSARAESRPRRLPLGAPETFPREIHKSDLPLG
jgi:hypothetical protein